MEFLLDQLQRAGATQDFQAILQQLLQPQLTDLIANGADDWFADVGDGLQPLLGFSVNDKNFDLIARVLVAMGDRHLDQAAPIGDVSLGQVHLPFLASAGISRIRLHAVLASAVSDTTLLSFRIHRVDAKSLKDLAVEGIFSECQKLQLLEILAAGHNFVISGPAGSGKTTLLRAMLMEQPFLRTVVVEDAAELLPLSADLQGKGMGAIGLQARQQNVEGAGFIGLQTLAEQALRMRPDRLVIGEIRGAEASVLLMAMNTGHRGSAATIHANSADAVAVRLRSMMAHGSAAHGSAAQGSLSDSAFRALAQTAIQKVIHLSSSPRRHIAEICDFRC
ncbi:MAG: hypothetical protein RJA35_1341 [Actinomycetota bacterium]|jgi:pilus assembly protein CpaF